MKILIIIITAICIGNTSLAQFGNLLDRAKNKVNNKINQKIDEKMDKAIDKSVEGAEAEAKKAGKGNKKKSNSNNNAGADAPEDDGSQAGNHASNTISFKSYSKFDFVPGEKLITAEDFSQDAVGDFPAKWNTNGNGEIVTTSALSGKFLMTQKEVVLYPEWVKDLPDNFTLEFDLLCSPKFSFYSGAFVAGFTTAANIGADFGPFKLFTKGHLENGGGFEVGIHPENAGGAQGITTFISSYQSKNILQSDADQDRFAEPDKTHVRVSIWRQKTRVRVYLNDKKIWDLPRALPENLKLNSLYFRNDGASNDNDAFYLGNIRLAVGAPDTRNKLLTEGKFVTHGILFDVNSDKIKPESYGAIKDIATVLSENESVNVKIIGHTDSDGDEAANLTLSQKRAEAVKNTLSKEFNISASRMQTEGMGESKPIANNNTPLGKASNRRVEFVKQ